MSDAVEWRDYIADVCPDAMVLDERFDGCIIGIVRIYGMSDTVGYDVKKIIEVLKKEGLSREDAEKYFEFNIRGAYVGKTTPVYIDTRIA